MKEKKPKADSLERLFYRGSYADLLNRSFDAPRWVRKEEYLPFVIGALSFTGRLAEAKLLAESLAQEKKRSLKIAARFFLGVGLARHSQYAEARVQLGRNLRERDLNSKEAFFVYQGLAFYRYLGGRFPAAERASKRSLEAAIASNSLYGRTLAHDIRGHILVQLGEIPAGLKLLKQAEELARTLGDGALPKAIEIAALVYRSRYGLNTKHCLRDLEQALKQLRSEDNYSRATLFLEYARQLILRGQADAALTVLDQTGQLVYASQNRRHEVSLNLRYAYLFQLSGESQRALSFIQSAKRALFPGVDLALERETAGLEYQIVRKLGMTDHERQLSERLLKHSAITAVDARILARNFSIQSRARKGMDLLGDFRDSLTGDIETVAEQILRSPYHAFLLETLEIQGPTLQLDLLPGTITIFDKGNVLHREGLTPLLRKLILKIALGGADKGTIVRDVWGYRYDSLRHDTLVYTALASLRKLLGSRASWLVTLEEGYMWREGVAIQSPGGAPEAPEPSVKSRPGTLEVLNFRQLKILKYLKKEEFLDTRSCMDLFRVSEITASRDLSDLTKKGLILRLGRGRAIRYIARARAEQESL